MKVVKMISEGRIEAKELYEAAGKVFRLPSYEDVISYLHDGVLPAIPAELDGTPFRGCAVGKMQCANGAHWVVVLTNGGRLIEVEKDRVTINFKTAEREASQQAAAEVLFHQRRMSSTDDDACRIFFEDGSCCTDNEIVPEDINPPAEKEVGK